MNLSSKIPAALMAICLLSPTLASAKTVLISQETDQMRDAGGNASTSFQIDESNPESDRAWIELSYNYFPFADAGPEIITEKKRVPGLRFSKETKQVIYAAENGLPTVCAEYTESHFLFFHSRKLKSTGKCRLVITKVPASPSNPGSQVDDGFVVRYDPTVKLEMVI